MNDDFTNAVEIIDTFITDMIRKRTEMIAAEHSVFEDIKAALSVDGDSEEIMAAVRSLKLYRTAVGLMAIRMEMTWEKVLFVAEAVASHFPPEREQILRRQIERARDHFTAVIGDCHRIEASLGALSSQFSLGGCSLEITFASPSRSTSEMN